jgi:MFS family permease
MSDAEANPSTRLGAGIALGLHENWQQFSLLVLINAFVGGMVGLERTVVPLIGAEEFRIASTTIVVSFIVSFGVVKAIANLVSGHLADVYGRKHMLVLGWLIGLPVPFMIAWGPSWGWIIAANALLGVNQGFAWSMTVIMKVDLVGPKSRGLAVGLNEFAGYLSVGVTAFLTGYIAQRYGLRPAPFYLGIVYAVLGLALSILVVRDTRHHVGLEIARHAVGTETVGFWQIFRRASLGDRNLFAASQAGLVNNLNDGMSWGIFPLFFAAYGLGVERIGILKAVYPAVWGILQTVTGALSDRFGRKGLIVAGYVGAGGGFVHDGGNAVVWLVAFRQRAARTRHRHGLSHPHRRSVRCIAPLLACAVAQCVPVLARSRLCDRRALSRHNCRLVRRRLGDCRDWRPHLCVWCYGRRGDARAVAHPRSTCAGAAGSMKALFILNDLPLGQRSVQRCATARVVRGTCMDARAMLH